jgi:hypothetical protein
MKALFFSFFLVCLSALAIAGNAHAKPPHGKAKILHCGCVAWSDGTIGMAYVPIEVSSKAKGHVNHVAGTTDSCYDGVSAYVDVTRSAPDCQVDGTPLDELAACTDQVEFTACEVEAIPQ